MPVVGGVLGRILTPLFRGVAVDPEARDLLLSSHRQGDVVYTLRAKRVVDPLFLEHILGRLELPPVGWLHDHYASDKPATVDSLLANLRSNQSSLLFLKRPRTLTSKSAYSEHHVEALVRAQREWSRSILLVPITLQWTSAPSGLRRSLMDAVFGDRDAPGATRELVGFCWRYAEARFHVAAPVELNSVIEREPHLADAVIAKKVRWTILNHLAREERLRTGPLYRPAARTRQAVRNDPHVKKFIAAKVEQGGSRAELEAKADTMLKKIAADMRVSWLRVLDVFIDFLWNRIYDGIQVDPEGLKLVRRAARRGPVVVVPSHKSHIDYLVLSQVFWKADLIPPHIAAGENLDFWPVGAIFRRGGAFFLRRSFRSDKLYATVFAAYVRRLLREGHAVEFFIEGGRSRTGKLLAPKMGMLAISADPVLEGSIPDVSYVPVSIGYEKIIEAGAYAKELAGGAKRTEDVTALVSSAKVLRSRYGRVYVDFDEPVSLRELAAQRGMTLPLEKGRGQQHKQLIQQLGHRIVYGINRVTRVTPTSVAALVLLAGTRRGMGEDELMLKVERTIDFLRRSDARLSSVLEGPRRDDAIAKALGRLVNDRLLGAQRAPDGTLIYQLDESGRVTLDYYKNNILHFFVPAAIVTAAVLAAEDKSHDCVLRWARRISQLLKNEVSFRGGATFEDNFDAASALLLERGTLLRTDTGWLVPQNSEEEVRELAGILAVFFEAYRIMGETLARLDGGPLPEKVILEAALNAARRKALEGRMARAEAASQVILRQGLSLYLSEKAIRRGERGTLVAGENGTRHEVMGELSLLLKAQPVAR